MARTKSSKITEKDNTKKIEEKENTDVLTNIENLENELKEEYKEETAATEEAMSEKEPELSIEKNLDLLKEYSDTSKKIEEITNVSDINEIGDKVADELKKAEAIKEELSKSIAEAEKTLTEKEKEVLDNASKGRAFSSFWNGVSYNW